MRQRLCDDQMKKGSFFAFLFRVVSGKIGVLEKDPRGSKVLERCDIVSTSEIKAGKEQLDHEEFF